MTSINHFGYGWLTVVLSLVMSISGCLLGIMLASKARRRHGVGRARLLIYATLAFGGIGIWQSQVIALLGVDVPAAVVRYDPVMLGLSLIVALVDVGTGLYLVTRARLQAATLIPAGLVIGLGAAGTSYAVLGSLQVSADVTYDSARFAGTVVLCLLMAPFALASIAALRGLLSTVVASVLLGLVVCGIAYGGQWSLIVHFRQSIADVPGLSAPTLMAPLILGGCTAAFMLAYFTIGSSTLRELRAIYGPHDEADAIEPWLIEEVTMRVASGTSISPLSGPLDRALVRGVARPRPTPGIRPTWHRMPVWGQNRTPAAGRNPAWGIDGPAWAVVDQATLARNDADRLRSWPTAQPRPAEPTIPTEPAVANGTEAGSEPLSGAEVGPELFTGVPAAVPADNAVVTPTADDIIEAGAALPRRTVVTLARSAAENVDLGALAGIDGVEDANRRWRNRRRP
ncbi:MAG: MHYT domain-containing protein [Betaproteobacteria bacterium]